MRSYREELMRRSLAFFHKGKIAQADQAAAEAVLIFPDDGELWQLHGLLRQRLGDHDRACSALETAGLLVPLSPAAQCALADCHARAGRKELARELYRNLVRVRSCPTSLLASVASGLGGIGDDAAALDVYHELAQREPNRHDALFGVAYHMRLIGHAPEEILPVIDRAQNIAPEITVYRVLKASLLAQLGRFDEACEALRDAKPRALGCSGCLRRVMTFLDGGRTDEFLETFREHADRISGCRQDELP